MSGIALFVPSDEMYEQAVAILAEKENHVVIVKKIRTEDAVTEAQMAISQGVNIIIARGRQAMDAAYQMGIPGLYIASIGEAIRVALKNAESLYYMSEIEQYNYAQFATVLDSAFNGIMKVGAAGKILVVNRAMEQIIGCRSEQVLGKLASQILVGLDATELGRILSGESENYSTFLTLQQQSVVVSIEPIVVSDRVDGGLYPATA